MRRLRSPCQPVCVRQIHLPFELNKYATVCWKGYSGAGIEMCDSAGSEGKWALQIAQASVVSVHGLLRPPQLSIQTLMASVEICCHPLSERWGYH